jgi:hypothetical protein
MYDCLVDIRQRKVEKTAENSEKIVASLFPKAFRDKMYIENQNKAAGKKSGPKSFHANEVNQYLDQEQDLGTMQQHTGSILDSPPMAELYPNCKLVYHLLAYGAGYFIKNKLIPLLFTPAKQVLFSLLISLDSLVSYGIVWQWCFTPRGQLTNFRFHQHGVPFAPLQMSLRYLRHW